LPYISDSEAQLDEMIGAAKTYGASFVFVGALTLFGSGPTDSKTLCYKFIKKHYPDLLPKYKSLFRIFSQPPKQYQEELDEKASKLCRKHKIKYRII